MKGCDEHPDWSDGQWGCIQYEAYKPCGGDRDWGDSYSGSYVAWKPLSEYADSEGVSAADACCACKRDPVETPTEATTTGPTTDPSSGEDGECKDKPFWSDGYFSCADYERFTACGGTEEWNSAWDPIENYYDLEKDTAYDACCACKRDPAETPTEADSSPSFNGDDFSVSPASADIWR